ncbi:hypothetical protein F6X40_11225 [Paraburkholderia sp. UCT31]|uniref:hypothetical protein n=1 Tax=Paraburkholderia sp. UCT31 TaxID=2615209 RepID=UPI00165559FC|nr:hypothetical protein [Paraburkholderia sp. UCT31]MBC8737375.1 hypothetical protein [Paraburkholderia sp. UCT31]
MNKNIRSLVVIAAIGVTGLTSGCASMFGDGTHQDVSVNAVSGGQQVAGASCQMENSKGTYSVTTPGTVKVHRASSDLTVTCEKAGGARGVVTVKGQHKEASAGHYIANGPLGYAVDESTGAAYEYPASITVEFGKTVAVNSAPAGAVKTQ